MSGEAPRPAGPDARDLRRVTDQSQIAPEAAELPSARPETLALGAHRFGALVCYDNVFDGPFREPLARGEPVAFHLVVSNEAWYRESVA